MDTRILGPLQERIAILAIGPSALRNQGAPGVVGAAREYLKHLNLENFQVDSPKAFRTRLANETEKLREAFPAGTRHWGAARKALNIFLRDAVYNRYLWERYNFGDLEAWLEVPLDSEVAKGLQSEPEGSLLPKWPGVKYLSQDVSNEYQDVAERVARRRRSARVHLDLLYRGGTSG